MNLNNMREKWQLMTEFAFFFFANLIIILGMFNSLILMINESLLYYGSTSPTWITIEQPLMAKLNWRLRGESVCEKENPLIHTHYVECSGDLTQSRTVES